MDNWPSDYSRLLASFQKAREDHRRLLALAAPNPSANSFLSQLENLSVALSRPPVPQLPSWGTYPAQSAVSTLKSLEAITTSYNSLIETQKKAMSEPSAHMLRDSIMRSQSSFTALASPIIQASKLAAALESSRSVAAATPAFRALSDSTAVFSRLATAALGSYHTPLAGIVKEAEWLRRAPAVEQYAAARALAVESHVTDAVLRDSEDPETDSLLERVGDDIEARLAAVSEAFLEPYRGAHAALRN